MMRKGITWIVIFTLLCGFSLPCAAQTVTARGDANSDVNAKYAGELVGCYTDNEVGGSTSVTTDEGITVAIKGLSAGLILVVMPILQSDTQAWNWFSSIMTGKAEKFTPFDIYFIDKSGNKVAVSSDVQVTISVPEDYTNPAIYNLFSNETINTLSFVNAGKTLTFTYAGNGYIVLASAMPRGKPSIPKTGDDSDAILLILVFGASLLALSGALIAGQNRKRYKIAARAATKGMR